MSVICVIRPEDDADARQFSQWWEHVAFACPATIEIEHLEHGVTRQAVEGVLPGARLIIYFGHGTEESLCRKDGNVIFLDKENIT